MGKVKEQDYLEQFEDFVNFTSYSKEPSKFVCSFDGNTFVEVETNIKNNRVVIGQEGSGCVFLTEAQAIKLASTILTIASGLNNEKI